MKRMSKSMLGVTLLEIMLVLSVAAMIIVMSVRYYQTATYNQQANTALQTIQAITATMDGLAQASGSYLTGCGSATCTAPVASTLPGGGSTIGTPWGTTITVTSATATTYLVTFTGATPASICTQLASRLIGKFTTSCAGTAFSYTYNNAS